MSSSGEKLESLLTIQRVEKDHSRERETIKMQKHWFKNSGAHCEWKWKQGTILPKEGLDF